MSAEESRQERARERFIILRLNDSEDEYVYVDPAAITSIRPLEPTRSGDALCAVQVDRVTYRVHESAETVLDTAERMLARRR